MRGKAGDASGGAPSSRPSGAVSNVTARVRRRFRASPERVFDAWLEPRQVRLWLGEAARREGLGELATVEIEPRVGASFRFVYGHGEERLVQSGRYLELDRPRRLVFSWDMALPHVELVVIDITPTADGCELVLDHVMDPGWSGDASGVTAAWASVLEALGHMLAEF